MKPQGINIPRDEKRRCPDGRLCGAVDVTKAFAVVGKDSERWTKCFACKGVKEWGKRRELISGWVSESKRIRELESESK